MKIDRTRDGVRIAVRVQPRASRTEIAGPYGEGVKVRLAAPPVEGEANRELVEFLAKALGVPRSSVRIARGERSRSKTVEIEGVDPERLRRALSGR